jgi:hypothetical protein
MESWNAEHHYIGMHGVQKKKLLHDEEQANHTGQAGI